MLNKTRKNVTLYTKKRCQQCKLTKLWLDEHGIHYKTVDIIENKQAAEKIKQLGYQTVPVVVIQLLFTAKSKSNSSALK